MRKRPVGRGLASLIPESALDDSPAEEGKGSSSKGSVLTVSLAQLRPNPEQPREVFNPVELEELTESIRVHGILSPLVVRKDGGDYILIAGERRMRAAGLAGLTEVPVVVREADDAKVQLELALVENLQRSDLNPIEAARGFQRLKKEYGYTDEQIASAVGKKRATITNLIRILQLPDFALQALRDGVISHGHAKALLGLKEEPSKLRQVLAQIHDEELNVRQVEALVDAEREVPPARSGKPKGRDTRMSHVEQLLVNALQTRVSVAPNQKGGGRITINYDDAEELERLIELLQSGNA